MEPIDAAKFLLYVAPARSGGPTRMHDPETPPKLIETLRRIANGEMIARIESCAGASCTNVAIGGTHHDRLHVTESASGSVLVVDSVFPIPKRRTRWS